MSKNKFGKEEKKKRKKKKEKRISGMDLYGLLWVYMEIICVWITKD